MTIITSQCYRLVNMIKNAGPQSDATFIECLGINFFLDFYTENRVNHAFCMVKHFKSTHVGLNNPSYLIMPCSIYMLKHLFVIKVTKVQLKCECTDYKF